MYIDQWLASGQSSCSLVSCRPALTCFSRPSHRHVWLRTCTVANSLRVSEGTGPNRGKPASVFLRRLSEKPIRFHHFRLSMRSNNYDPSPNGDSDLPHFGSRQRRKCWNKINQTCDTEAPTDGQIVELFLKEICC